MHSGPHVIRTREHPEVDVLDPIAKRTHVNLGRPKNHSHGRAGVTNHWAKRCRFLRSQFCNVFTVPLQFDDEKPRSDHRSDGTSYVPIIVLVQDAAGFGRSAGNDVTRETAWDPLVHSPASAFLGPAEMRIHKTRLTKLPSKPRSDYSTLCGESQNDPVRNDLPSSVAQV